MTPRHLLTGWLALSASIAVGCLGPTGHGTAVGNPPDTLIRTAESETIAFSEAMAWDAMLELVACDGSQPVTQLELGVLDLLAANSIALPKVQPCSATLWVGGIELEAEGDDEEETDGFYEMEVELESVTIDLGPSLRTLADEDGLDGGHVLELAGPDWLLGLRDPLIEDDVVIGPADPRHAELQASLTEVSAMWADLDEDDVVLDDERTIPVLAAWESPVTPRNP